MAWNQERHLKLKIQMQGVIYMAQDQWKPLKCRRNSSIKCGLFNEGSEQDGLPLKVREKKAFQEEQEDLLNGTEHNNNSKAFRKGRAQNTSVEEQLKS